jgi:hypothetical protein
VEKISVFPIESEAHSARKKTAVFLTVDNPVFIQSKLYHRSRGFKILLSTKRG